MSEIKKRSKWAQFVYDNAPTFEVAMSNPTYLVLMERVEMYKPETVLEFGSGTAYMSIELANRGYFVTALDTDPDLIKFGQDKSFVHSYTSGVGEIRFAGNMGMAHAYLADPNTNYDVVFSQGLIEHYDDEKIGDLLAEMESIANKAVIFSVPSDKYPFNEQGDERKMSVAEWEKILLPLYGDRLKALKYYSNGLHILGVIEI